MLVWLAGKKVFKNIISISGPILDSKMTVIGRVGGNQWNFT